MDDQQHAYAKLLHCPNTNMGGVCLLHERGWHEEVESDKDAHEDLRMLAEAQLVKDKYNTDYYIFNNLLAAV